MRASHDDLDLTGLVKVLEDLPLAFDQAAAYIEETLNRFENTFIYIMEVITPRLSLLTNTLKIMKELLTVRTLWSSLERSQTSHSKITSFVRNGRGGTPKSPRRTTCSP